MHKKNIFLYDDEQARAKYLTKDLKKDKSKDFLLAISEADEIMRKSKEPATPAVVIAKKFTNSPMLNSSISKEIEQSTPTMASKSPKSRPSMLNSSISKELDKLNDSVDEKKAKGSAKKSEVKVVEAGNSSSSKKKAKTSVVEQIISATSSSSPSSASESAIKKWPTRGLTSLPKEIKPVTKIVRAPTEIQQQRMKISTKSGKDLLNVVKKHKEVVSYDELVCLVCLEIDQFYVGADFCHH